MTGIQEHIPTEWKDIVASSLALFACKTDSVFPHQPMGGTGILTMHVFASVVSKTVLPNWSFNFHDHVAGKPWAEQCRIIAAALGPCREATVLMVLSYGLYDGWTAYNQLHKMNPVFPVRYWINQLDATDAAEAIKQEV